MDQALWRYVMRVSRKFFKTTAHKKYLNGLSATGIPTDHIPSISEMDQKMKKFGWRAVCISGFIPPSVFMEFQSLGILPIACDIRKIENLHYTPTPDIIHEAAGHAPILADAAYAQYLKSYGEISRHAIITKKDMEVYEAIRFLSEIKEDPKSSPDQISKAQSTLDRVSAENSYVSEATELARFAWWTTEYGLIGDQNRFLIYGAGLLSSVGESYDCIQPQVKKVPLSLQCMKTTYDITKPQPQLFVSKDFSVLTKMLKEYAKTMAYQVGGVSGLKKAKEADFTITVVLDSGIQISGVLEDYWTHQELPFFLKFKGPTQLAHGDHGLRGHAPDVHAHGFSAPLGRVKGEAKPLQMWSLEMLEKHGFSKNKIGTLEFESGITLNAKLKRLLILNGVTLVITFTDCEIKYQGKTLYDPKWGDFDLACGTHVVSVFGGAADRASYSKYTESTKPPVMIQKTTLTPENSELNSLYAEVRKLRTHSRSKKIGAKDHASRIMDQLKKYPDEWLIRMELLEILGVKHHVLYEDVLSIAKRNPSKKVLIERGLELFS